MCDFNTLTNEEKFDIHNKLLHCADQFGGKNYFLQLIEALRNANTNPLTSAQSQFDFDLGDIKWNKVIFNDKLQLLQKARVNEGKQNNFLPKSDEKNYKKILNVVRTLKPIVFHVTPANKEDGSGFFFQPFDVIDDGKTMLNPIFDILFFCSIDTAKKILNFKP